MTELEGVESGSRGSRRRLRGARLKLGLLDGLSLVSRALLVAASSTAVSSSLSTSSLTVTLLLFEGWLVWPALDSAQLLSLVPRSLSSFPLLPGETDGLSHVGYVQGFDTFSLIKKLGETIEGTRELRHDQHCLEVIRHFKPRRIASGEVGRHLVDSDGGILLVGDLDVHGRFELEIGGDDTRFPVVLLKVVPKQTSSIHGFGCEVSLDLGSQSEHDVTDGLLVIILPVFDFLLVSSSVFV